MPRDDPETCSRTGDGEGPGLGFDPAPHGGGAMKRLLVLMASLLGCGSNSMAAVVPVFGDPNAASMSLEGTIDTIHFQNINKARGRYTYNVEVRVLHEGISGSPHEADQEPGEFRVRVNKVYWSAMDAAEQATLAPDGPQHTMTVERWHDYAVGQRVRLDVATWGPGLGARRFPASDRPTSSSP